VKLNVISWLIKEGVVSILDLQESILVAGLIYKL